MVTFFEELGRNYVFNVLRLVLYPSFQVRNVLILQVEQVHVVFFLLAKQIRATLEFLLAINDDFTAEDLQRVVEILDREDDARSTRQCLNISPAIPQLCQEFLHEAKLLNHVQMTLDINLVVESCSELLEWVDSHLDLWLRDSETATQSGMLSIKRLYRCSSDELLNLVRKDHDLCFR